MKELGKASRRKRDRYKGIKYREKKADRASGKERESKAKATKAISISQ